MFSGIMQRPQLNNSIFYGSCRICSHLYFFENLTLYRQIKVIMVLEAVNIYTPFLMLLSLRNKTVLFFFYMISYFLQYRQLLGKVLEPFCSIDNTSGKVAL